MNSTQFTIKNYGSNNSVTTDDIFENFGTFMSRRILAGDRITQLTQNPFSDLSKQYSVNVTLPAGATSANVYMAISNTLLGTNTITKVTPGPAYDCGSLATTLVTAGTDTKSSTTNIPGTCTYNLENYTVFRINGSAPRSAGTYTFRICP